MIRSSTSLRVGLVGAGHIFPFHVQALKRLQDVQMVGLLDCDGPRAEKAAQENGLKAFISYGDLLAEVDVVHILTPPDTHADLTVKALVNGCHVFVEKPLASSLDDCQRIIDAARKYGRIVGVDHSLLLDPFTLKARRVIERGGIGRVQSVECLRSQDLPTYEGGPLPDYFRDGGYPFRDLGIHAFYQIESFLGPICDVKWSFHRQGASPLLHFDEWQAMVRCQSGAGLVRISWNTRPLQDVILIHGSLGRIKLDRFGLSVTVKRQLPLPEHPRRVANAASESLQTAFQVPLNLTRMATRKIRRYHGLQAMVEDFYRRLRHGEAPLAGPAEARRVGYWLEKVAVDADRQKRSFQQRQRTQLTAETLVTGATGFIGGHLLDRLLRSGGRVRILCRRLPTPEVANCDQVEVVLGDLGDPEAVDRAVKGIEVVYHVGGVVHGTADEFVRGSVAGTENVVSSSLRFGVRQLIHVSSLSVLHALHRGGRDIDEDWPLEPFAERRGLYTRTKLLAERVVTRAVRQFDLPAVILRPGEVIGSGAPLLSSGIGHRKGGWLVILGNGKLTVPLINVEDLVDAIIMAREQRIVDGSIIHLVDPGSLSQTQLAHQYCQATGERLKFIFMPRPVVYALGLCAQWTFGLLGRPAPISLYRLRSALADRHFNVERACRQLKWQPRLGIAAGLRATVDAAGLEAMTAPVDSQGVTAPIKEVDACPNASASSSTI